MTGCGHCPGVPVRGTPDGTCRSAPVAVGERRGIDRLAVDVGTVRRRPDVHDGEVATLAAEFPAVPSAHRHVIEEDVAVRMPTGGGRGLVQQKARSGVGATLDQLREGLCPSGSPSTPVTDESD